MSFLDVPGIKAHEVDAAVTAKIEDAGSTTRGALNATFASVVSPTARTNAAVLAAITAAGTGGTVYLGPGDWPLTSTWTFDRVALTGVPGKTRIVLSAPLGDGVPAIVITATTQSDVDQEYSNFKVVGTAERELGVRKNVGDGIKITLNSRGKFRNVEVGNFDNGIVLASDLGHLYFDHVVSTNNYYGVYCTKNTFDYMFTNCLINGNTFANFATPSNQGFEGIVIRDSHIGFAPYGIYQEATPINQGAKLFLQDAILSHCRFEAIGNGAIVTDAQQDGSHWTTTNALRIEHPGFSWSATYKIAARDKNYAVVLGLTERVIDIMNGAHAFLTGDLNVFRIKIANHAAFEVRGLGALASQVTVDTGGTAAIYAWAKPVAGTITPAGDAANRTIALGSTTGYIMPESNSARRFGGDSSYLYADISSDFRWRNSASAYALIGRVTTNGISMPKYYIGAAGSTTGPTWTSGAGVPAGTEPTGSIYTRTDGTAGATFYVREAGVWVAK